MQGTAAIPRPSNNNQFFMLGLMLLILALLAMTTLTKTAPPSQIQKKIAIVEDDKSWQDIWIHIVEGVLIAFGGGSPAVFPNCEALLAKMNAGERFNFYIMDNDLGAGRMKGPQCVASVRQLHPQAIILGNSGNFDDPGFVKNGASRFVPKINVDIAEITKWMTSLLQ